MSNAVHPTIAKKAAKQGVALLASPPNGFRFSRLEDGLLSEDAFDTVAEAMAALEEDAIVWQEPASLGAFCGVMVKSYHDQYSKNPHGPGCGDSLDVEMRECVMHLPEGAKEPCVDLRKLRDMAILHNCWQDKYTALNPGMQRMNVANRLRGMLRNNPDFTICWDIGSTPTRCGIQAKAKKGAK